MKNKFEGKTGRAVPSRRLSRLAGLGGMAVNIAGGMAAGGVKQLASGKRPKVSDLFMTPSNARKLTRQLSSMRGAAMKIGQMISMDSGDFLPREFADILARLRADAQHMPRAQLNKVLKAEWGEGWQMNFAEFDYRPIAAASIGQVHKAKIKGGDYVAIKVQYPGVRDSIDSDVKNVAGLLKMSGMVPASLDINPIIEEGRQQLHQEADYVREADYLCRFGELLSGEDSFEVPGFYPEFSTDKILTMSFSDSRPIEDMADAPQGTRDKIMRRLMDLTLRELFAFKLMQTDPNFANYRYDMKTDQLVLLDFGASRQIDDTLSGDYKRLLRTLLSGTAKDTFDAATEMGLLPANMKPKEANAVVEIIDLAMAPLGQDGPFDFGGNGLAADLRDKAMSLAGNRELWHVPPAHMVFTQRKLGGVYMLASRLKARVNVRELLETYVAE
ncbi:ABC1 kinase family protein [Hellea balneolensis]|uniref:ABC1 kinase family protein n=1 Tax=Hellea balneolensis TaxID=287478 RepID=UPI000401C658|nr:AarF/ABC1/UbiB kinase family protein [Hellea balneolensis]